MKIYFSNYRYHWLSPYTILEKVFFWREIDYDEPIIEKWSTRLEPFCNALLRLREFVHPQIKYVKIDRWDTWSMYNTLADITLPMLKQLKETKHGAPYTDDEDVPEHLKSTNAPPKENEWDTDGNHFDRWDWVLDQMIFAFEHIVDDSWEEQFWSGEWDRTKKHFEDGWEGTRTWDKEGHEAVDAKIQKGLNLFGKYYRNLWD
jgi:hypothetical protein